tara:strand:- start:378 stop:1280 length:903 start_codon:yes stop_codon:yes gene_type:complete
MNPLESCLKNWSTTSKPIYIKGGIGVGKTYLCYKIVYEYDYHIQEIELNNIVNINALDCFSKKKVILIDDLDIQHILYKNVISKLKHIIKEAKKPLIIVGSNEYKSEFIPIIKLCKEYVIRKPSLSKMLEILKKYNIPLGKKKEICIEANGDIRYAIINTIIHGEKKIQRYDIFSIIKNIFSPNYKQDEKEQMFSFDLDYVIKMLYFNYPRALSSFMLGERECMQQSASYADDLSCMDLLDTHMKENGQWSDYPIITSIGTGRTYKDYLIQSASPCKFSFKSNSGNYNEDKQFKLLLDRV